MLIDANGSRFTRTDFIICFYKRLNFKIFELHHQTFFYFSFLVWWNVGNSYILTNNVLIEKKKNWPNPIYIRVPKRPKMSGIQITG